jgi:hypothetical protein
MGQPASKPEDNLSVTWKVYLRRDEIQKGAMWGFHLPQNWAATADVSHHTLYFCANRNNVYNFKVDSVRGEQVHVVSVEIQDLHDTEDFCSTYVGDITDTKTNIKVCSFNCNHCNTLIAVLLSNMI